MKFIVGESSKRTPGDRKDAQRSFALHENSRFRRRRFLRCRKIIVENFGKRPPSHFPGITSPGDACTVVWKPNYPIELLQLRP